MGFSLLCYCMYDIHFVAIKSLTWLDLKTPRNSYLHNGTQGALPAHWDPVSLLSAHWYPMILLSCGLYLHMASNSYIGHYWWWWSWARWKARRSFWSAKTRLRATQWLFWEPAARCTNPSNHTPRMHHRLTLTQFWHVIPRKVPCTP